MRRERGQAAHEIGREFRDVVALRAFLDVLEVIEAEQDDLAGIGDRQRVSQTFERNARRGRRLFGEIAQVREIAIGLAQDGGEIGRQTGVDRLQVDDLIPLHNAQPQALSVLEPDNPHVPPFTMHARLAPGIESRGTIDKAGWPGHGFAIKAPAAQRMPSRRWASIEMG